MLQWEEWLLRNSYSLAIFNTLLYWSSSMYCNGEVEEKFLNREYMYKSIKMYELRRKQSHLRGITSIVGTQGKEKKTGLEWEEIEWQTEEGYRKYRVQCEIKKTEVKRWAQTQGIFAHLESEPQCMAYILAKCPLSVLRVRIWIRPIGSMPEVAWASVVSRAFLRASCNDREGG